MPIPSAKHAPPSIEIPSPQWHAVEVIFYLAGFVLMVAAILASIAILGFIVFILGDILFHIGSPHWNGLHFAWT